MAEVRRAAAAGLVAAVLVSLAGCGDMSGTPADSTPTSAAAPVDATAPGVDRGGPIADSPIGGPVPDDRTASNNIFIGAPVEDRGQGDTIPPGTSQLRSYIVGSVEPDKVLSLTLDGDPIFTLETDNCTGTAIDDEDPCSFEVGIAPIEPGTYRTTLRVEAESGLLTWTIGAVSEDDGSVVRTPEDTADPEPTEEQPPPDQETDG